MGRTDRRRQSDKTGQASSGAQRPRAVLLLEEAQTSQQRAERKAGRDAIQHYSAAVANYTDALQAGLPAPRLDEARFGMAESLQGWAEQALMVERKLPDEAQSAAVAQDATSAAASLLERAVAAYRSIYTEGEGAWTRADAAVNCANALSQLAELRQPAQLQIDTFKDALTCYQAALALEADALTWSNLADALVQLAQAWHEAGNQPECLRSLSDAHAAYMTSCSLSSSEDGDDLPGLLCNWGTAMTAAAGMLPEDRAAAVRHLDEAVSRLKASIGFNTQDIDAVINLGEAYKARAEVGEHQLQDMHLALSEGFDAALRINATNGAALVSKAECHVLLARAAMQSGDSSEAQAQMDTALLCFERALSCPSQLGSFSERCSIRYNYACALALAGKAQQATAVIAQLLRLGATTVAELMVDPDLSTLDLPSLLNSGEFTLQ